MAEFCYQCTEEHFGDGAKNDFVMSLKDIKHGHDLTRALCEGCEIKNTRSNAEEDLWTIVNQEGYCVSHRCRTHNTGTEKPVSGWKCGICRKHKAEYRDYRFIESCGLQGKVLACNYCRDLNDETISEVIRGRLDPKVYFEKEEVK